MVSIAARIPEQALTAQVLGTERRGSGVAIDGGLIATVGYLVADANDVWLGAHGRTVPAWVLANDYDTGLALLRPLAPLNVESVQLGASTELAVGEPVVVSAGSGRNASMNAAVIAKKEFAGYWEYVLDEAIFTAPAHPNWGGAGLFGSDGRLYGIGSLLVQQRETRAAGSNMFVPIDLLGLVLAECTGDGIRRRRTRPWLGFFVQEVNGCLAVSGLYVDGPAAQAGVEPGDIVTAVGDAPVRTLAQLFRQIWDSGEAGTEVPLTVVRSNTTRTLRVQSVDRGALARPRAVH
ncbi:MAG: S1C family serine protease [Gammaproteobacteria bacterium]